MSMNQSTLLLNYFTKRLGHRSLKAVLAGDNNGVWSDIKVNTDKSDECVPCDIATIQKKTRTTFPVTPVTKPGEAIYLDIISPLSKESIAPSSKYTAWLIIVNGYSRYTVIYGLESISTSHVINRLQHYKVNYKVGNFEYIDINKIKADARSQFVSNEFQQFCTKENIISSIAAPKQEQTACSC